MQKTKKMGQDIMMFQSIELYSLLYVINKMKLGIRPHAKYSKKDEDIQPWSAQESTMLHLIIQSGDMQINSLKNSGTHLTQDQAYSPNDPNKQRHSYNFNNNLRKYEKMKADSFQNKKQVNFIEKNIKGVSQDFMFLEENSPNLLMNKLVQEKQRKERSIDQDLSKSIEPVNWSLIMWYEEDKALKKFRHRDIQSFLRTQSRSAGKRTTRRDSEERSENAEDSNKSQAQKYQRLLKLREGLRKRNLKSASQSRKVIEGSMASEDNYRTIIQNKQGNSLRQSDNSVARSIPKSSQTTRNDIKAIKFQRSTLSPDRNQEKRNARFLYTSHRNRLQPKKISLEYRSRVK